MLEPECDGKCAPDECVCPVDDAVLFPSQEQYYLVERSDDSTPTRLVPIAPPASG